MPENSSCSLIAAVVRIMPIGKASRLIGLSRNYQGLPILHQVRDSAPLPEEIVGVWQIWNQGDKRWIPSENVKVTAVGNERVDIKGTMPASCSVHQVVTSFKP